GRAVEGAAVEPGEDRGVAVAALHAAPAAELRFDDGKVTAGVRMRTADDGAADRTEIAGGQEIRHVRRKATQHQVEDAHLDLEIETVRRRLPGIEDRARPGQHLERAE